MKNTFPIAIATWKSGLPVVKRAGQILRRRGNILDAVERGCNVAELDINDLSVGYGGLPNEDGIVELDAAIMDGRTHGAGTVMGLRQIKLAISVARKVMETTRHVNLVGEGALQFALKQGFQQEVLLTDKSIARYQEWLAKKRKPQFWKNGSSKNHDTMGLVVRDAKGNLATGCTTSGMGFKISGRVGDSPIIGSGLYVDNDVGGASATGVGEEILRVCASYLVVELMRQGQSPQEACENAAKRILSKTRWKPTPMAGLIALRKDGEFGGASTRKGFQFAVWTPTSTKLHDAKFLVGASTKGLHRRLGLK